VIRSLTLMDNRR